MSEKETQTESEKQAESILSGVLAKPKAVVPSVGGKTEGSSEYDLALSYAGEWHPFVWGMSLGVSIGLAEPYPEVQKILLGVALSLMVYAFTGQKAKMKQLSVDVPGYVYRQISREPHYYGGGFILGLGLTRAHNLGLGVWNWAVGAGIL